MKKQCYVLFVDLTAAFDHINRKLMFKTISKRPHLPATKKLFELLESLYSFTSTALSNLPDYEFKITTGVRQGGPESSFLFNLFIDFVMRIYLKTCKQAGVKFLVLNYKIPETAASSNKKTIGKHTLDWIGYADDLVLMFDTIKDLKLGLKLLNKTFDDYQLTINVKKTKTMIMNPSNLNDESEYPSTLVSINKVPVENVKEFVYLGCVIKYNEPTTGDAELNLRIDVANNKFYELEKKL